MTFYYGLVTESRKNLVLFGLFALLAVGVTLFNGVLVLFMIGYQLIRHKWSIRQIFRHSFILVSILLLLLGIISLQNAVNEQYSTDVETSLKDDISYFKVLLREYTLKDRILRIPSFIAFTIVGLPVENVINQPTRWWPDHKKEGTVIDFVQSLDKFTLLTVMSLIAYAVFLYSVFSKVFWKRTIRDARFILLMGYFLFTIIFFTFFGEVVFLYSQLFTFSFILLLGLIQTYTLVEKETRAKTVIIQSLLLLLILINNIVVVSMIHKLI